MKILVAIDNSAAARPVLMVARMLSETLGLATEAIHVATDGTKTAVGAAMSENVELRILEGDPVETILRAIHVDDVALAVTGMRGDGSDAYPAGRVALALAGATDKPIALVPARACERICESGFRRVLVPVSASDDESSALRIALQGFADAGLEFVGIHVLDTRSGARSWDRPEHESVAWDREFAARHCWTPGTRLEVRVGLPSAQIIRVAAAERVDLIAIAWSRQLGGGRGKTVHDVLSRAEVPVLLVPIPVAAGATPVAAHANG